MSQVPYDPLLDQTGQHGTHSNPTSNSHHSTPQNAGYDLDDPVQYQPPPRGASSNPNLYAAGGLGASGIGGAAGMAGVGLSGGSRGVGGGIGSDFGLPVPQFANNATRSSAYSTSTVGEGDRHSTYGSIAALRDSQYQTSGGTGGVGAAPQSGELGNYPPARRYTDHPSERPGRDMGEKENLYEAPRAKSKRKGAFWAGICVALVVLIAAIALPVYFLVIKPKSGSSSSPSSGGGGSGNSPGTGPAVTNALLTGGDGSIVTKSDGTTFVYNNTLGGYWVYDPNNPLNGSARAQSYTPPLSEQWKWGVDRIYGVNIGGWLNLEPFISPALYEPFFPNAVDEWTLSEHIQARDGNLNAIENHYATFITEEDFAQIAAAGLNWVRIPIPFWAIGKMASEPFLERRCWNYFLKAIEWARKYGLRINLDLHAVPGSQNGWNHSGKLGDINFLNGVMGIANAQRTLDYIRIIAEFISQPEYKNVVPFFGILNEPQGGTGGGLGLIPKTALREFYAEAYRVIRTAGGSGAGNGPVISLFEGFFGLSDWPGFLAGADRLAMDTHPYLIFTDLHAGTPADFAPTPCGWGDLFGSSMSQFGITTAGEWSHAINDCGLYLNAVGAGTRYEGTFQTTTVLGNCDQWNDWTRWDQSIKDGIKQLSMSSMDALGDWFFWTWKIGPSLAKGRVETPFWSYKLALDQGWAITDPRQSKGQCQRLGLSGNSFVASGGTFSGAQVGDGVTDALAIPGLAALAWPPEAVGGFPNAATLPTYTATGPIQTLPVTVDVLPSLTRSAVQPTATTNMGNGWNNAADQGLMHVPAAGCAYPDAWNANNAAVPNC